MIRSAFAAFLLLATPCIGQAKVFRTSYLETQLPPSWACERKETEWLCRDNDTLKSREAIVVFTAKKTSPTETITDFKKYIEWGAVTPEAAQFLEISMFLGKNILVSGGTGYTSIPTLLS